ncbi:MAG: M48 family metallopeptidase [Burkholderiales bacterium]|nr:M48 family metallopeptidase [Burkholderiales bacterium]
MRGKVMQLELALDAPLRAGARGALRHTVLAGGALWYALARSRRRPLCIRVDRGGVAVRAPRWTPLAEIESFLRDKERWIRRRLEDARRVPPPFVWASGERLPLLGEPHAIRVVPGTAPVRRVAGTIEVALGPDAQPRQLRGAVLAWLRSQALEVFTPRLADFATRLGLPVPELRLSSARTQWGSCSARGRILLNWRLVHLPPALVDYVVAHEMAHLKELNHSRRFWAVVESLHPGCGEARRELERLGRQLPEL